jgi:hypothetical protein
LPATVPLVAEEASPAGGEAKPGSLAAPARPEEAATVATTRWTDSGTEVPAEEPSMLVCTGEGALAAPSRAGRDADEPAVDALDPFR